MILLLSIFVLVFIVALLLVKYLTPISLRATPSLLWRGFAGGALGVGLAPLIILFSPYMFFFPLAHSVFTPLWGMIFTLIIEAANCKSESEMGVRDKIISGALLGFATGVILTMGYPHLLGHPNPDARLASPAMIIWLLLAPLSGVGAGIMSATLKSGYGGCRG